MALTFHISDGLNGVSISGVAIILRGLTRRVMVEPALLGLIVDIP